MIKLLVPDSQVTSLQISLLSNVENNCVFYIKEHLNKPDYKKLRVAIKSFEIVPCRVDDKNNCRFTHDASFSIPNSFNFVNEFVTFVIHNCNVDQIIPSLTLHIVISLKLNDNSAPTNSEKDSTKIDETPDFFPEKAKYSFSQVILPDDVKNEILDTLKVIECKELIYDKWGFSEVEPVPKGVINFYGAPGTGKTMCAHAVASQLKKSILALNYSEIESKYVGEAAKNLQKAFDVAANTDSVLFFDEADSFLGKRIQNVTQGSDQAINSLRSQMLILLEEFSGVVIFATNLVTNFDSAFESRILKHIHFNLPNQDARAAIIKKMIPSKLPIKAPFTEEQYLNLSSLIDGFSGREIKNAILDTLLSKASNNNANSEFCIDDFALSFKRKKEELERLKKEQQEEKKTKILKALAKKVDEDNVNNTTESKTNVDPNLDLTKESNDDIQVSNKEIETNNIIDQS